MNQNRWKKRTFEMQRERKELENELNLTLEFNNRFYANVQYHNRLISMRLQTLNTMKHYE